MDRKEEPESSRKSSGTDVLTVLAIGLAAYALVNVAHEGLGHGGACVALGGKPVGLNAIYFDCDEAPLSIAAKKGISAAGSLVNVLFGGLSLLALRRLSSAKAQTRYFLWLLVTLNLLQATGYLLFSGLGNIGDWAKVIEGWSPHGAFRAGLSIIGGLGYVATVRFSVSLLYPLTGGGEHGARAARMLTLWPYLAGGTMYVAAGLLNPVSLVLVLISAAAASFGGASALSWMAVLLQNPRRFPADRAPIFVTRSIPWLVFGAVLTLLFVGVLGRTIQLAPR